MTGALGNQLQVLQEASQRLQTSLILMQIEQSTPAEYQRVFADIARARADAIMVHARGELLRSRQLIVELVEKSRLPAMYPWREYVESGGLMAYASDFRELGRRMADDVHEILNRANPGDIFAHQIRVRHKSERPVRPRRKSTRSSRGPAQPTFRSSSRRVTSSTST
jgi:ABC-type uncharacterized transport system substrate-binding protein